MTVYTDGIKKAIENIPEGYRRLSEPELRAKLQPCFKMYELKRAFWEEFTEAQEESRTMRSWRIYDGKYGRTRFHEIIKDPLTMAWIASPLTSYQDRTKAALDKATERYEELITMDIKTTKKFTYTNEAGEEVTKLIEEVDPKKALVVLQVIKNLEDRVKGTAIQRNVNVNTSDPKKGKNDSSYMDMNALEKKLVELESKLLGGSNDKQISDERKSSVFCGTIDATYKRIGEEVGDGVEVVQTETVERDNSD